MEQKDWAMAEQYLVGLMVRDAALHGEEITDNQARNMIINVGFRLGLAQYIPLEDVDAEFDSAIKRLQRKKR